MMTQRPRSLKEAFVICISQRRGHPATRAWGHTRVSGSQGGARGRYWQGREGVSFGSVSWNDPEATGTAPSGLVPGSGRFKAGEILA
jgi:hypothetical protein